MPAPLGDEQLDRAPRRRPRSEHPRLGAEARRGARRTTRGEPHDHGLAATAEDDATSREQGRNRPDSRPSRSGVRTSRRPAPIQTLPGTLHAPALPPRRGARGGRADATPPEAAHGGAAGRSRPAVQPPRATPAQQLAARPARGAEPTCATQILARPRGALSRGPRVACKAAATGRATGRRRPRRRAARPGTRPGGCAPSTPRCRPGRGWRRRAARGGRQAVEQRAEHGPDGAAVHRGVGVPADLAVHGAHVQAGAAADAVEHLLVLAAEMRERPLSTITTCSSSGPSWPRRAAGPRDGGHVRA